MMWSRSSERLNPPPIADGQGRRAPGSSRSAGIGDLGDVMAEALTGLDTGSRSACSVTSPWRGAVP